MSRTLSNNTVAVISDVRAPWESSSLREVMACPSYSREDIPNVGTLAGFRPADLIKCGAGKVGTFLAYLLEREKPFPQGVRSWETTFFRYEFLIMCNRPTTTGSESRQSTVRGQIERVTFYNEETDVAIARLRASGHRDLITPVGTMMAPTPGQVVRAVGEWTNHPKFGEQFKITRYTTLVPATVSAIEKYLGVRAHQGNRARHGPTNGSPERGNAGDLGSYHLLDLC